MKIIRLIFVALLLIFVYNISIADSTGAISGKVIVGKTGLPPLGAKVRIIELNREVSVCPVDGKYFIQDIPTGYYSLKVEYNCYDTVIADCVEIDSILWIAQNMALKLVYRLPYAEMGFPEMFSNCTYDLRPIIDLRWRLQYANPYGTVDKLITIWAQ
jgi:hypothetical protein